MRNHDRDTGSTKIHIFVSWGEIVLFFHIEGSIGGSQSYTEVTSGCVGGSPGVVGGRPGIWKRWHSSCFEREREGERYVVCDVDRIVYGDALIEGKESVPSPQELREAQAQGQELFLEVVAVIVAEFAGVEDKSARDELLEPVYEQHEAMRLARRRRRAGTDIDPDTGDELSSPDHEPDDEPDDEPGDALLRADQGIDPDTDAELPGATSAQ